MNREPIALYIFRYVLGLGMFAFMSMLYWSSVDIEENLQELRADIAQVRNDLFALRLEKSQGMQALSKEAPPSLASSHSDLNYPNLLEGDPFYKKTLPNLLGVAFKPLGTFHDASIGRPDNLHPFSNWAHVIGWNALCTVSLAKMAFGRYETLAPELAIKMEERKRPNSNLTEYWVHLRKDLYWHPLRKEFFPEGFHLPPQFLRKNPVTAHDVAFYWEALMNPHVSDAGAVALRTAYDDIEEIKVIDDYTLVVRWKAQLIETPSGQKVEKIRYLAKSLTAGLRPLPQFVYKYFADGSKILEEDSDPKAYRTSKLWAQNFSEHWAKNIIVSCGPWNLDGMSDKQISFKRNPDFYSNLAALAEEIVVAFKGTTDAIWESFKENQIDNYVLPPNELLEWKRFMKSEQYAAQEKKNLAIRRLDYLGNSYTYIGWNMSKPLFASRKVRQALTMGIDRQRIIEQNLNSLGIEIACPFYPYSTACDPAITPYPFDLDKARRLLEEEGWNDKDGDGILSKEIDGKNVPFKFKLTYFVKNSMSKSICEYVATALKQLKIDCSLNGVDIADLSAIFDEKSFDALYLAWGLGTPPEDPKQLWHSSGALEKGSSNAVGFINSKADALIEELLYEENEEKRTALYHQFDAIIHDEQPYTFLFTPKTLFLYREYLQNVFIPMDRQDLVPGANVAQPDSSIFWLKAQSI